MNKKVVYILLIISILTILFGFFAASNIRNELVSGYNETSAAFAAAEIGSSLMSVVVVSFSFFIVGIIWLVYFVINFVKRIFEKKKK
jgi:hypothetical protein